MAMEASRGPKGRIRCLAIELAPELLSVDLLAQQLRRIEDSVPSHPATARSETRPDLQGLLRSPERDSNS